MEIEHDSLDDALMTLYEALPREGRCNIGTRGETLELLGVAIRIRNPRARISRSDNRGKLFSALGELLWYLSKKNDVSFIKEYVAAYEEEADADGTIHGGYGPRLFAMRGAINQIESITKLLTAKPTSRRAVIQLFNAEDVASPHTEVPCTTTLQFFQREEMLHMAATLRSNDAYIGLPHDFFCFTMLQEMMACRLGVELGEYYQFVGSMHVYKKNLDNMAKYIGEGYQKLAAMPRMPPGDPFTHVPFLLTCEQRMRKGEYFDAAEIFSESYWADLTRLLQVFWATRTKEKTRELELDDLVARFDHPAYRIYIENRRKLQPWKSKAPPPME